MARPWTQIVLLWLIGVLAAAQLAKFAVMAPILRERFSLSLPQAGLLISLLEVGGALFGIVAGLAIGRLGARRLLHAGLALLAGASAVEGFSNTAETLFAARAVEGIGYLLVVIAAPTLIIAVASTDSRSAALTLWSTFVPVGMAFGSALTGLILDPLGFRGTCLAWAAAGLVALIASLCLRPLALPVRTAAAMPGAAVWFATLGFGCYTIYISALTALLPTYLVERTAASIGDASVATALASIAALPGAAVAFFVLRTPGAGPRRPAIALISALLATAVFAPGTFAVAGESHFVLTSASAIVVVMLSGAASAITFARLPTLSGARSGVDSRVATANGLVTQFGAAGALVGPPLGALIVDAWGWVALGMVIALLAFAMLCLVLLAEAVFYQAVISTSYEANEGTKC